jgi:cytochrome c oxidase subunit I
MQLMDRVEGTSFFLPSGLVVGGQIVEAAGGGSPLLWQHLFWFLAHPEVYVLILPALGIVAEVIANNTRKPLWGYRAMVYATIFLGFMSFIVWAHHMFLTGMGTTISAFFQTTTMIISIPSVIILTALFISLWGSSMRFNVPMLFALAFLPMFGIGGLTGLPLGLAAADIHLHDTYYVIGHFHYVVAPGTIFAMLAGIYFWYPKVTGRKMNEKLGKIHFWLSLICINVSSPRCSFRGWPVSRAGSMTAATQYAHAQPALRTNVFRCRIGVAAAHRADSVHHQLLRSIKWGEKVGIESLGCHHARVGGDDLAAARARKLREIPVVLRGPYEYNAPGDDRGTGLHPQHAQIRRLPTAGSFPSRSEAGGLSGDPVHVQRVPTPASTTASSGSGCFSPPR